MQQASARERQEEVSRIEHLPDDQKEQLDARARQGETVVPGRTGGKSLDAQLNLAKGGGNCFGGKDKGFTRKNVSSICRLHDLSEMVGSS